MYDVDARWKEIKDAPESSFPSPPAQDVIDRASAWSLPETFSKIVRVFDEELCQVTEHVFTDASKAMKFIKAQINDGCEVTYYDDYNLHSTWGYVQTIEE